jgi:hypothetical protein
MTVERRMLWMKVLPRDENEVCCGSRFVGEEYLSQDDGWGSWTGGAGVVVPNGVPTMFRVPSSENVPMLRWVCMPRVAMTRRA